MNRPDLASTFTKVALWRQTQFRKIVYVDADVVALQAPDELFNIKAKFAAVPDIGWPDCFNSGVLVLNPNMGDYYALLALAQRGISFDGADQGMLNMHFREWHRLSFTYNCTPSGNYQYVPAYRHFQSSISMVHFIGQDKPWVNGREVKGANGVYEELLGRWWAVYDRHYRAPVCFVQIDYARSMNLQSIERRARIRSGYARVTDSAAARTGRGICCWLWIFIKRTSGERRERACGNCHQRRGPAHREDRAY